MMNFEIKRILFGVIIALIITMILYMAVLFFHNENIEQIIQVDLEYLGTVTESDMYDLSNFYKSQGYKWDDETESYGKIMPIGYYDWRYCNRGFDSFGILVPVGCHVWEYKPNKDESWFVSDLADRYLETHHHNKITLIYSWGRPIESVSYKKGNKYEEYDGSRVYQANVCYGGEITKPEVYVYKIDVDNIQDKNGSDLDEYEDPIPVTIIQGDQKRIIEYPYDELKDELRQTWNKADKIFDGGAWPHTDANE